MDPMTMAALGAALGYVKSEAVDRPQEKKARQLASETQRWSPWTGMQAGPVKNADPLGNMMQGGFTGASLGQGMAANKAATAGAAAAPAAGTVAGGAGAYNLGVQYPQGYTNTMQPGLMNPSNTGSLWNQMSLTKPTGW